MKLRIATWNIHKGVSALARLPRVHGIKQALASIGADIVFLQEVQGRHDLLAIKHASWPSQSQHEFLASDTQHSAYGKNAVYDHGHHGNALISNYPITAVRNHDVSDHAFESRGILHCAVTIESHVIHCYVVHLGLFAGSRLRQTEALIEAVSASAPAHAPLLIAGDFNDWTNALSDHLCARLGVVEVFDHALKASRFGSYLRRLSGRGPRKAPARTFPAAMPMLQLDRVYVRGFDVVDAKVLFGASWARLSDHAPIVTELMLRSAEVMASVDSSASGHSATSSIEKHHASGQL